MEFSLHNVQLCCKSIRTMSNIYSKYSNTRLWEIRILYHSNCLNSTVRAILLCTYTYTGYSQHATIIKISQLNDRLRAGNDSCKNSSRSFRASSAVHSKSSQRKGSSRFNPSPPATAGPNSVPLFFARATLPCRCPIISRITMESV